MLGLQLLADGSPKPLWGTRLGKTALEEELDENGMSDVRHPILRDQGVIKLTTRSACKQQVGCSPKKVLSSAGGQMQMYSSVDTSSSIIAQAFTMNRLQTR